MVKKFCYISLITALLSVGNLTLAASDAPNNSLKTNHSNKNTNSDNKIAASTATDTTTPNSTLTPNSSDVDPIDDKQIASATATDTTTPNSTLTPNSSDVDPTDDKQIADASDETTPTKSTDEVVKQDKLPIVETPKTVASAEDITTKTNETIDDITTPNGDEIKASKTTTETTTPSGETTTTTETTITSDETTKTNETTSGTTPPKPTDNPINCGIENCHGLEVICSEKEPPMCTLEYMLGDKCRQYAKCAVVDGKCQMLPSDDFEACKTCVEKCKMEFIEDVTQAILCEADCV